jgi:RsiW-degrading membrane proteinase PrsW (M82 family)
MSMDIVFVVLILVLSSFIPPIIYMMWLRNSERFSKEPWVQVFKTFIYGAVFGVIIALVLSLAISMVLGGFVDRIYLFGWDQDIVQTILLVVIIAPFVEEFAKGVGVYTAHQEITEPEDGLVYGASCGLGFAATENVMYGLIAYSAGGLGASLLLIGIRSISSALLHASATSVMGYGIGRSLVSGGRFSVIPYYLLAVLMHAVFNYIASLQDLYAGEVMGVSFALVALVIAIAFAVSAITIVRLKIMKIDREPGLT